MIPVSLKFRALQWKTTNIQNILRVGHSMDLIVNK